MVSISGVNPANVQIPTVPEPRKDAVGEDTSNPLAPQGDPKTTAGVAVTISSAGFQAVKNDRNKDIDDSNLKDNVKQLLKMIRELKKQIADKMAEIAAAMADTSLTPEQRQARVGNLQSALSTLQGSLTMAQMQLGKAMKDESPEAQLQAMSLASK
ncbi:hypothetical protein ACW9IB_09785 [Pseudomonas sp. SDO524_S393]